MSFTDTAAVLEMTELSLTEWLVLLALAHIRNSKSGLCNPSLDTIARYAHLGRSTIPPALKRLRERGLIDWIPQHRISNKYILRLEAFGEPQLEAPSEPQTDSCGSLEALGEPPTCNPQPPRSSLLERVNETDVHTRTVPYSVGSVPDRGDRDASLRPVETPGPPETIEHPAVSSATPRPHSAPPPSLTYAEAQILTRLYAKLSGCTDLVDILEAFTRYTGPLSAAVIANAMRWAYKKIPYWRDNLEPTAGDFLRALKTIHKQYEKFYKDAKKKPHQVWDAQTVLDQEVPPVQSRFDLLSNDTGLTAAEKTYLEGEVELSKSKAFELED